MDSMNILLLVKMLVLGVVFCLSVIMPLRAYAALDDVMDLHQEQAKEKEDLNEMKGEINDIKATVGESMEALGKIGTQLARPTIKEFHLSAKEGTWELFPGTSIQALTYNGHTPGPLIRVEEGDRVRIVVHNQLKTATSLHLHGLLLPQGVDGLPRKGAGLIAPGETYAFQFVANQPGTYWYHPQIVHSEQQTRGLYGGIVVEPKSMPKGYEKEIVAVLGQYLVASRAEITNFASRSDKTVKLPPAKFVASPLLPALQAVTPLSVGAPPQAVNYFTVNGKCAPGIPPIEVNRGQRVHFRIINASQQICPLHLSGHKFEVMSINGADGLEPHISRDTISIGPADRVDLEFSADNPGVWSFASALFAQSTNNGQFPGGIACVVRYLDDAPIK